MSTWLISTLVVVTGCVALGVGAAVFRHRLMSAQRVFQKTAALSEPDAEGWEAWFVGGFSHLAMGTRWLRAWAAGMAWGVAGLGLIGLGLRLLR